MYSIYNLHFCISICLEELLMLMFYDGCEVKQLVCSCIGISVHKVPFVNTFNEICWMSSGMHTGVFYIEIIHQPSQLVVIRPCEVKDVKILSNNNQSCGHTCLMNVFHVLLAHLKFHPFRSWVLLREIIHNEYWCKLGMILYWIVHFPSCQPLLISPSPYLYNSVHSHPYLSSYWFNRSTMITHILFMQV